MGQGGHRGGSAEPEYSGVAGAVVPKELGHVTYDMAFFETEFGDLHSSLPLALSRIQVLVREIICELQFPRTVSLSESL